MFEFGVGRSEVEEAAEGVDSLCRQLDPKTISDGDVPAVFDALVGMQKRIEGAVVRMAARYDEAGAWKRAGARSAADDIARKTGTSAGQAKRRIDTSRRLDDLPSVDTAVRNGELSPDQTDEVTDGATASPEDTDDLLDTARRESLQSLRRRAAEARAKADADRDANRRRIHRQRRISRWTDDDGAYNLRLRIPADWGAEIDANLKPRIDRIFADARHAGRFEPIEAYGADAAFELLSGRSSAADQAAASSDDGCSAPTTTSARRNQAVRPERKVIATIDVAALNRGWTEGDETAVIAGVGPVSVNAIRALLSDAFLAVVIKDGIDILNVTHLGRQVTAAQRTALEARGHRCEVCGSTHQLDIDHVTGWNLTKQTRLDDLACLCSFHHGRKTNEGLWLVGPPGRRRLVPPDPSAGPPPDPVTGRQSALFT